ncbi:hypothetical protein FGO68_gene2329 [Halteria grandinella]|uniref:Uncharacterized protein n=1 Tax=Halteria grandinella TaxID=5974 RepID=A0A8J8T7M6_HALGN|nr:hypothetical protein FGO68_gene2329 [Halteria grandinella]
MFDYIRLIFIYRHKPFIFNIQSHNLSLSCVSPFLFHRIFDETSLCSLRSDITHLYLSILCQMSFGANANF